MPHSSHHSPLEGRTPARRASTYRCLIFPITPPLRGSRSSQAARRRLLRWGVCGPCGSPGRWGAGGAFDAPPTGATSGLRPRLADSPSRGEWCVRAVLLAFDCVTACETNDPCARSGRAGDVGAAVQHETALPGRRVNHATQPCAPCAPGRRRGTSGPANGVR